MRRSAADDGYPGTRRTNAGDIARELNDIIAVVEMLEENGAVPRTGSINEIDKKKAQVRNFLDYAKERGTVLSSNPADVVIGYLRDLKYDVFCEVQTDIGRIDIVAVSCGIITSVEVKNQCNFDVLTRPSVSSTAWSGCCDPGEPGRFAQPRPEKTPSPLIATRTAVEYRKQRPVAVEAAFDQTPH